MWSGWEKNGMLSQVIRAFRSWDYRVCRDCRGEKMTVVKQGVFLYWFTQSGWSDCLAGAVMAEMALSVTLCIGLGFPNSISAACSKWSFIKHFGSVPLVKCAENGPWIPCLQASASVSLLKSSSLHVLFWLFERFQIMYWLPTILSVQQTVINLIFTILSCNNTLKFFTGLGLLKYAYTY